MARTALKTRNVLAIKSASYCKYLCKFTHRAILVTLMLFTAIFVPDRVNSAQDLSFICDQAAAYAAQKTGVPVSVLQAISLTETGRNRSGEMRPWPWTVNMEGKGVWFDNEDDARAYVYKNYKRGARSFDVGCFQINYKWHGHEFASIEEMFDPNPNALYAANFLLKLYREKGDWSDAAGAYHSRTPKYADKYEKRFNAFRTTLLENDASPPPILTVAVDAPILLVPKPIVRTNHYPLLLGNSGSRALGSLVPLGTRQAAQRLVTIGGDDDE